MHESIKEIIPESYRNTDIEKILCSNVTYILSFPKEFYHELYQFEEYIRPSIGTYNYYSKLREKNDKTGAELPSTETTTNYPLGLVINVEHGSMDEEINKALMIYMLKEDTKICVTKIDNTKYMNQIQQEKEDFFNSLFEVA